MEDLLHLAARPSRPEMGWAECPACERPFLSIAGVRARCPGCQHVFTVGVVTLGPAREFASQRSTGAAWLLRIEIRCARAWAEAKAAGDSPLALEWCQAWTWIKAQKFGQRVTFREAK
jgi:hypothetical protein